MKQFNRFLDPKKDLGSFSGMVCLYLLVMVFVSIILTFAITLFMFGRYGLEMAEKQEYVENLINGNGIQLLLKELEEKSEGRAQILDLDLRLNLSTRKKLRDHEYEVTVF